MIKLIAFDLDNVLIDGESLDEIAKKVEAHEEFVELTRTAMEGDINFETSLRKRMEILKGTSLDDIKQVVQELPLMEGAEETIKELKGRGYKIATITGNFEVVTDRLKDLDIDYIYCNQLHQEDGVITGEISGPLIVEGSKADVLEELVNQEGLTLEETAAVGDGANDIPMIEKAGLGIAFNAKPAVRKVADVVVDGKDLKEILAIFELDTDNKIEGSKDEEPDKRENMNTTKDVTEPVKVEDVGSVKEEEPVKGEATEPAKVEDVGIIEEEPVKAEEPVEATDVEPAKAEEPVEEETAEDKADAADVKDDSKSRADEDAGKSFGKLLGEKKGLEKTLKELTKVRDALNEEARTHKQKRDELNASIKEILDKALEFRKERDTINQEVKKSKKLRDETNQELKKLEWSSGKRDIMKIQDEIKKLDKTIETKVLDIRKENELVKKVTDLQKKLQSMQEDENTKQEALDLKEQSETHHAKVVELSDQAQETHEKMLEHFQQIDEIRSKADEAHAEFIAIREKASAKHGEVKSVLKEIRGKNKSLDKAKAKERSAEDRISEKKNSQEKEKAEEIYRKFRDGKKLSTDELLLLQKHNIV